MIMILSNKSTESRGKCIEDMKTGRVIYFLLKGLFVYLGSISAAFHALANLLKIIFKWNEDKLARWVTMKRLLGYTTYW